VSLAASSSPNEPLLKVDHLCQWFGGDGFFGGRQIVRAVDDVTLTIARGEVLGLVGESGSGKSTLGRAILYATKPTGGRVIFDSQDLAALSGREFRRLRGRMQMIFQDPFGSLNPRMTVSQIIAAPLKIQSPGLSRADVKARVAEALRTVGLSESHADRYPHEFSGGQRQRVGIARAFVMEPNLLVADEPVSALDVSIQAQIVNLLMEVKKRIDLAILFISHDLAVVGHLCDRVAVMYFGRIVEVAETRALFRAPRHPYTEALFSAVPRVDPASARDRIVLTGELPSPLSPPSGCAFRTRCRYAIPDCAKTVPPLADVGGGRLTACIRPDLWLRPAR
jgi:oligopeptide/dipeptide ABC transporter ATP-binding protein